MSARRFQNVIGSLAMTANSARVTIAQLMNRIQNARLLVRIQAQVDIAANPAVAIRNGGWLSSGMLFAFSDGGRDTMQLMNGRLLRGLSQAFSAQPIGGSPLASTAIGTYQIDEYLALDWVNRLAVDPYETAYKEADPNSRVTLDGALLSNAIACIVEAGTAVVTLSNVVVTVTQYGDPARATEPLFTPNLRVITQPISGASSQDIVYTPTRSRLRSMFVSPQVTTADGGFITATDAISALRLIGDDGRNIIGPNQTAYEQLLQEQTMRFGGQVIPGLYIDFQDGGRLSNTIVPPREFPNLRFEFADQPSALGTSTQHMVVLTELTRTPPFNGYPTVSAELPDWLQ